jgi:hypothetical protein
MNPTQRCDEIIKMIDEVLREPPGTDPRSVPALSEGFPMDRPLASTASPGSA